MSTEAEQNVLGGLMLDNSKLDLLSLEVSNFEALDSKVIFQAILELHELEMNFDVVTITEYLEKNNKLNLIGGMPFLIGLANNTSTDNIEEYAKIITRDFKSLKLKQVGREIAQLAEEHGYFEPKLERALGLFDGFNLEGEKDLKSIKTHVSEYARELERRLELDGIDGLTTGFELIDTRLKGLKGGELYIIAGRPASGKSTYALNMANHIAQNVKTIFFSMEMPSKQLIEKSVASLGQVDLNWLKQGLQNDDSGWGLATEGMSRVNNLNLVIDDNGYQTIQSIKVKCKKQGKLGAVFVDYLQLMAGKGNNRTEQIGEISRGLKQLAKDLDCPVIALSQLNRSVETRRDKRPLMSDLRDSGAIEQDADVIQFIYRDEYYYEHDTLNKGVAEIHTAKFRHGEIGTEYLSTELHRSRFLDLKAGTNYQAHEEQTNKGGFDA